MSEDHRFGIRLTDPNARRNFTEYELVLYAALVKLEWQPESLDAQFIRLLQRKSTISENQAKRIYKLAYRRLKELPESVVERIVVETGH